MAKLKYLVYSKFSHTKSVKSPNSRNIMSVLRFVPWFFASLLYLASGNIGAIPLKLILVFVLIVEGLVAEYFYGLWAKDSTSLAALVGAEAIGVCLLLIPTGGLESPFIWYALNIIFAAASFLPEIWCYSTSAAIVISAIFGSYLVNPNFSLNNILHEKGILLISFLTLTVAAYQTAGLVRKLTDVCHDLEKATGNAESMANHTRALYQALEACSSEDNAQHLTDLLASYAAILTQSQAGFCILWKDSERPTVATYDNQMVLPPIFKNLAGEQCNDICETHTPLCVLNAISKSANLNSHNFMMIPIEASCIKCGVLGCFSPDHLSNGKNRLNSLQFLSELGSIVIERCELEGLSARLKVYEEQNRIANEIHDGVSQYLFGLTCGLHSLATQDKHIQEQAIQQEFELLERTANQASRELRSSIYRISPAKRGDHLFISKVDSFLKDQAGLNKINIAFTPVGSEDAVSPALRTALFRIIREATSNAIRHGKANNIRVSLSMAPHKVTLDIWDDGEGFNPEYQVKPGFEGIGLMSMKNLMDTFDGSLDIDSSPKNGTRVSCVIPANG